MTQDTKQDRQTIPIKSGPGQAIDFKVLIQAKLREVRQRLMYDLFDLATLSIPDGSRLQVFKNHTAKICKESELSIINALDASIWNIKNLSDWVEKYFGSKYADTPENINFRMRQVAVLTSEFVQSEKLRNFQAAVTLYCDRRLEELSQKLIRSKPDEF